MVILDEPPTPLTLLLKFLKQLRLDWPALLYAFAGWLRKTLCALSADPFEILDYEATLELKDTAGKLAHFAKRLRVKFLQNTVIAFEDYAWGDGEILAAYKCAPGVVVDKYKDGDRWNILISLREAKDAGDIEGFYIERTERNTFTRAEEWLQTEIRRPTRRLRMDIIFPRQRPCRRALLLQRRLNRAQVLGPEHFRTLPDGRQLVTWETRQVTAYDIYTLKWKW